MITKVDVDMVWYQQQKHFVNKTNETAQCGIDDVRYVLIKESSRRALAVCRHAATAKALSGYDLFAGARTNIRMFTAPLNRVWCHTVAADGQFIEDYSFADTNAVKQAMLVNQKAYALDTVHQEIQRQSNLYASCDEQSLVYNMKYREARHILEQNIEQDIQCDYPLITSYAEYKHMSLQQAAKLVKLQYDMQAGFLAEVELFRIKFRDSICEQTELAGVSEIVDRFNREFFGRKVV